MASAMLDGCLILIVEDEPIIAIDLDETFGSAGARVINAMTMAAALRLAEDVDLSAAVVDYGLLDGDSTALCARLQDRKIPFLMDTGYEPSEACSGGLFVAKPASPDRLLSAMGELLNLKEAPQGEARH